MKILFIAPIPPPIDGQSKVSKLIRDAMLEQAYEVDTINLAKKGLKSGFSTFSRFYDITVILWQVWKKKNNKDIIYLSLAESFLGNLRDIFIYIICRKNISKLYVHMLGGAGMRKILAGKDIFSKINRFYLKKVAGVIVEGPQNYEAYAAVMNSEKIHVIPNFAEDYLFVSEKEVENKFAESNPINILYLSNLIEGKGYLELANAFMLLSEEKRQLLNLNFVGGFEDNKKETTFLNLIKGVSNINYLGKFIDGSEKKKLFGVSHVFCLPTYYPYEGQPISILEAYATGCAVITTNHSGIPFIFKDEINGYQVEKKSVESLSKVLEHLPQKREILLEIARNNLTESSIKYRTSTYISSILKIFNSY